MVYRIKRFSRVDKIPRLRKGIVNITQGVDKHAPKGKAPKKLVIGAKTVADKARVVTGDRSNSVKLDSRSGSTVRSYEKTNVVRTPSKPSGQTSGPVIDGFGRTGSGSTKKPPVTDPSYHRNRIKKEEVFPNTSMVTTMDTKGNIAKRSTGQGNLFDLDGNPI